MDIYMDGSETRKISNDVYNKIMDLKSNINRLNSILDTLSNAWVSSAATNYINTMREKNIIELEKLCDVLLDYEAFLNRVPNAYETLDEIFSAKGFDF